MKLNLKSLLFSVGLLTMSYTSFADSAFGTLPELVTQSTVGVKYFEPQRDSEWYTESLNLNLDLKKFGCKIVAYQIKWFTGEWSPWFVPGVNDLYKKDDEDTRRQWACFNDHQFKILYTSYGPTNFKQIKGKPTAVNPGIAEEGSLPELSTLAGVGEKTFQRRNDPEWANDCLNRNLDFKKFGCKIIAYKIKWVTTGEWSPWYVPGVNDLYKNEGEPLRSAWAFFNDHTFHIMYSGTLKAN